MEDDVQIERLVHFATSFLEWVATRGDAAMRAAVSSSLQRATLALRSHKFETVLDGKDAVMYLRSLACQAQFLEVACFLDCLDSILLERLVCDTYLSQVVL